MNGHRALIDKGVYGHPRVERVPLCAKLPGHEAAGRTVDASVCLLDLAPTVLETAGIEIEDRLDGESLLPFIRSERQQREAPFLFESGWHVTANPAVSIRKRIPGRGHFLYTYNVASPCDELYDLEDERCRNLATDPAHRDVLDEMIRHLGTILQSDRRRRCYWHAYRLEKHDQLELDSGDTQMFVPE
jgi:arylsulfatase A-like enzyme